MKSETFAADRYDRMTYRRCGRSGLMLPAIALGGWHNFTQRDAAFAMMKAAFDQGVTHFDLANNYGPPPGRAEKVVGRLLRDHFRGHRDELIVSSKAGYLMWPGPYGEWGSRKHLIASCEQSLRRLRLDYVDIFYSHRPDDQTPMEETVGTLDQLVRQGKALYAGVSNYSGAATRHANELLRGMGTPLLIHQPRYHMLDRRIEDDLLPVTDELGIGVIVFSPLAQGLLTEKYLDAIPADSRASDPSSPFLRPEQVTEQVRDKVRRLQPIAAERNQSIAQLAVSWILRDARITSVLIGARTVEQVAQNVAALEAEPVSGEHLQRIEAILSQ
ncbi:MAG: aldo/keto reductase [Phycisphaeraceae bacterium]|nr:aldo/keto reductase [Phycisphaeraceae bacterium]